MKRHLFMLCASLAATGAAAAAPQLDVAAVPLWAPGARVPSNLLLDFSISFSDAGAAFRGPYLRAVDYAGYFNPRMCYSYPMRRISARLEEPDLDEASGYFSISGAADAQHGCRGAFSGNFLNWAAMATLDLLRLGLTGGDRVADQPGLSVLQRAWLPDGAFHPDFYAHPQYFPRKVLAEGVAQATPFQADPLYIVSCRNRVLFSTTAKGSSCDAPRRGTAKRLLVSDKSLGEYAVRVAVCSPADAIERPDLCRRRGRGFKPEGALQQADARIGVMGYQAGADSAMANGGILRAPLKFLGEQAFEAPQFMDSPNPRSEWNEAGVLAPNPDRASGSRSGAINAINKLGTSEAGRLGAYPAADPGAELFHESLRYLQGRAPLNSSDGADAGMAAWRQRADPVSAACQRNAVAAIGHASFIDDRYLPGNTRKDHHDSALAPDSFAPATLDIMQATRRVGALEASAPRGPRPELAALELLDDGPGGEGSYYLAGAAYWAHGNPIRPDLPVRVDTLALELGLPARARASALYLAAKYGGFDDRNGDASPFVTTGLPGGDSEWSVDGATPSRYFSGADPQAIVPSLRALVAAGEGRRQQLPGALVAAPGLLIRSGHDQQHWSGQLQAYASGASGLGQPQWDAAQRLDGDASATPPVATFAPQARAIYTLAPHATVPPATVPFRWDSLTAAQRTALDGGAAGDGLGAARLAWLRGERSRELGYPGGSLRRRASVLGAIVNSTPLVVGPPSAAIQDMGYLNFHAAHKKRRAAVYVGANDGMLHAFDAATGLELFAYVPNALMSSLAALSDPGYRYHPSTDGSPGFGEARIGSSWRTVLVSGMGMGARGVFALDISNPAAFDKGMGVLWEFTGSDDPAMGHVRGAPQVAAFRVGAKDGRPLLRYFAVVASGVNNDSGDGALFLLALDKPPAAKWKEGVNYYRYSAAAADPSQANVLSAPALAIGADGAVLAAYAGDLQGSLWRFNFAGAPPWRGAAGQLLFSARDGDGQRQPIAHAPQLVFAGGGGYLVLFGTGQLLVRNDLDPARFAVQSFYGIHDQGAAVSRASLSVRSASGNGPYEIKGKDETIGAGGRPGWVLDFPRSRADGERAAASAQLAAGALFIDTLAPGADPCAAPAIRSYALDALSGFAASSARNGVATTKTGAPVKGLPSTAPLLFELGMAVGPRDPAGTAQAWHSVSMLRLQPDGQLASGDVLRLATPAKRLSWREISNWQELHDAANK